MEKVIVYTQRVECKDGYNERWDCADQNIARFIEKCGYIPIPIPNVLTVLENFIERISPVGIVLTGGNSLVKYGGIAPERDQTDKELLKIAIDKEIPVYGFCRGMQSILDYFGCELHNVEDHVAVRHQVRGIWGDLEVNSYHCQGCKEVTEPLVITSMTEDGVIEAIECQQFKLMATMWHPERERDFNDIDIQRVKHFFG